MRISLPRNLFPQIYEDSAINPASRRKVVLPRITRQIMEASGFKFGNKIRVPGGYAFEVTGPAGTTRRVGLKTAVNRWLNTATTLVEMVDTVIVTTFEWDADGKPAALALIQISSADLLAMIEKVRKEATKRGWDPHGHYYMPLDADAIDKGRVSGVAGAVIPVGKTLFGPAPVTWVDDDWGQVEAAGAAKPQDRGGSAADSKPVDVAAIVAKAKANLALELGVSADRIDLSIRF